MLGSQILRDSLFVELFNISVKKIMYVIKFWHLIIFFISFSFFEFEIIVQIFAKAYKADGKLKRI